MSKSSSVKASGGSVICPGAHRPTHECEGIQFWPELCTVLLMGLMSGCRQA